MWNCRWLLCLVAIGLVAREASSMNEYPPTKNDFPKTRENDASSLSSNPDSEGKRKSQNESSSRDVDQILDPSPSTTATAALSANLTISNTTVALVPETVAGTSTNFGKPGSHDQSHSKRHFHRSKFNRKEARPKTRSSSTKSSVASSSLIPFGTGHFVSPSQDLFHNPDHSRDSMKLLESMPRTSSTGPSITRSVTTGRDDSISTASPRSLFTNGSKDTSDRKPDELSSTESSDNFTSSSSDSGSMIDEKSSSVELMAFAFDNVAEVLNSNSSSKLIKQSENLTSPSSIARDHSSSTTIVAVQTSDRSINKAISASANLNYGGIDRGQSIQSVRNDADGDFIIYSSHTDRSLDTDHMPNEMSTSMSRINMTKDDSVASQSPMSRSSRNAIAKGMGRTEDALNSTASENSSSLSRSDVEERSWESVDDSLNRISLAKVVDTLKSIRLKQTAGSYSHSNSTASSSIDTDFGSNNTNAGPVSAKRSRSVIIPDQRSRELRPSTSGDPGIKSSNRSDALSVGTLNEEIRSPIKLIVPLILDAITKAKTQNNIVVEDLKLSRPSTSTDVYSRQRPLDQRVTQREEKPFRLVLDSDSSSSQCSSSTEGLQNVRKIDSENAFHQRRNIEITPSVSGNSISDPELCLTRRSSAQTPPHSKHEPDRPIETLISSVIPLNAEEKEVDASLPVNKSHATESEAAKSFRFATDEHRGAQDLASSGLILLDDLEPVVHESLISEEAAVPFEAETTTTAGHFFAAFADLEEHCNASSYNIFLPSVNSRDNIAAANPGEENRKSQNLTTTEDSVYIIEGFGFLRNGADDISELEEMFDRKRDASFDYAETETYPGYPQPDDHPPGLKLIDQIEFEAELPIQQEPIIATGLQWRGNSGADQNDDPWTWFNDESKRRRGQVAKNDEHAVEGRTVLIPNGLSAPKEVHGISSLADKVLPDMNETNINSYRIFLLPTIYVLIGICVVLVGCSIWCSKVSVKKQPNLPKLTYFIQERQRATQLV